MRKLYVFLFIFWLTIIITNAQVTPFTANWHFEGNSNGTSSSGLVAASLVSYTNVNPLAVNPYTIGYVGLGVNVQNWSTKICDQTEYIQFSVQPVGTATITLTSLSFAFARSPQGPQQLSVRSSVDGFTSVLFSQTTTTTFQQAMIALNNPGFVNQAVPITFRIYACKPVDGGGTIRLDEIKINAAALPVNLLSFTAKAQGNCVQLAWITTFEQDANRFLVERSYDLKEYVVVGEVAAKGTTDERQYYGLTDLNPQSDVNYYRLNQIDYDGTVHSFKSVQVTIRPEVPTVSVYPNPSNANRIHLRFWNVDDAVVRLLTITGQPIAGRLERQPDGADWVPDQCLPTGLYWLEIVTNKNKQTINVLIH